MQGQHKKFKKQKDFCLRLNFIGTKDMGYLKHFPAPSPKNNKKTKRYSEKICYIFQKKKFFVSSREQNFLAPRLKSSYISLKRNGYQFETWLEVEVSQQKTFFYILENGTF